MMIQKNIYWTLAGILGALTTLLHLVGGQSTLVNPMLQSELDPQVKTEWLGAWHIVSLVLLISSSFLLYYNFHKSKKLSLQLVWMLGLMYAGFGLVFIGASLSQGVFAGQWVVLLPIGLLCLAGIRKESHV